MNNITIGNETYNLTIATPGMPNSACLPINEHTIKLYNMKLNNELILGGIAKTFYFSTIVAILFVFLVPKFLKVLKTENTKIKYTYIAFLISFYTFNFSISFLFLIINDFPIIPVIYMFLFITIYMWFMIYHTVSLIGGFEWKKANKNKKKS